MNLSFLIADSLHINQRNFSSFFKFIEKNKIKTHFEASHKDWIALYGVYDSKSDVLYDKIELLTKLSDSALYSFTVNDISLFYICKAELLSLVSTQPIWYDNDYPQTEKEIFDKLYLHNKTSLLQNMAAAWYWIQFWKKRITELPTFTHACIFSGGLIYQKALMEQLKYTPIKVMVMESLFTGNEYYCEERYSAIANNSDIKHLSIYKKYVSEYRNMDRNEFDKERTKAINKILISKNKNVQQPIESELISFNENLPCVSIIGQVVNDFSVLEYRGNGLATIKFYKELIISLAEEGFNVIMKTHPWEEKKNNIRTSLTKDILTDYVMNLPVDIRGRIFIVDNYNIKTLFKQSDYVVGLNSQGLLEAAFEGLKPVQFGNAFYGRKGFTTDYNLDEISLFVNDLKNHKVEGILSLNEYNSFELFITVLLQKHTVSIYDSGLKNLQNIFSIPVVIPLVSESKKITSQTPNSQEVLSKKKESKDIRLIETNIAVKPVLSLNEQTKTPKVSNEKLVLINNASKKNPKLKKLKTNPYLFFSDSKVFFLRPLKYFFKYKG